ncbi:hypothetical protein SAMN04487972_1191 [Paracoccus halophilus]|uniref:Uncharacterized protein n=1 Tax=Paracoccus halophilus TaxID=376733 RepID=A0A099F076_9RHOB|nr:hypothetical protein [Paracoccus halophilus]KGJ01723.1 hypothetical protein IT41_19425 [Paracoccus halophilus]KGJ03651.1 hypothetical protein IT41_13645 [Paracoccus halophilus]SFA57918.1 hypothetical protein SAMN04487972_1191 [Paracoccus halophilus]
MTAQQIARLERAHLIAARIVALDPAALPVFERLDAEMAAAKAEVEARRLNDPIARARALAQLRKAS